MKEAYRNKTIRTIPEGAWEGGIVNERKNLWGKRNPNDITTDLQGNGYPVSGEKHSKNHGKKPYASL